MHYTKLQLSMNLVLCFLSLASAIHVGSDLNYSKSPLKKRVKRFDGLFQEYFESKSSEENNLELFLSWSDTEADLENFGGGGF